MKKLTTIFLGLFFSFTMAQAPATYYDGTSGLTGAALKTKLSQIITAGAQDKGYDGLYNAYPTTDTDNFYEKDGSVLDMYSENPTGPDPYNYRHGVKKCGNYSVESDCYNREHIIPQSLFDQRRPMVSDVHHIRPTDGKVNGIRSNYGFGVVKNVSQTTLNGSKLGSSNSAGYVGTVFEPINEFKGDIARMVFYFITRYESQLSSFSTGNMLGGSAFPGLQAWELQVMKTWAAQDPVSEMEIVRNNASYVFQRNRNPFIDNPQWITEIWGPALATGESSVSKASITIYPNPVKNGELTISGQDLTKISNAQIFDVTGKSVQVIAQPFKNPTKIKLKNLPKGVYLLKIGNVSTKFIVE
jgi:endonuclease I